MAHSPDAKEQEVKARLGGPLAAVVMALALGAAPAGATTRVVDNSPASLCKQPTPKNKANVFTAIQPAIDASAVNDTVLVCSGTYREQVRIQRKGLRLLANSAHSATIEAPLTLTGADDLITVAAHGAQVSRFDVRGSGGTGLRAAIAVRNGATVTKLTGNRVLDSPGAGIVFGAFDADTNTSSLGSGTAEDNVVSGYATAGVIATEPGTVVTLRRTRVTGAGPTPLVAQHGIELRFGARGTLQSNKVTSNVYTGVDPDQGAAAGLLVFQPAPGNVITSNVLTGNQDGAVFVDMDSSQIKTNQVRGGQRGIVNDSSSELNRYASNRAEANSAVDCQDDSTGGFGTAGTSNAWTSNVGALAVPRGICRR
jgi:nitrous oxidase accessory protein NosD